MTPTFSKSVVYSASASPVQVESDEPEPDGTNFLQLKFKRMVSAS